MIDDLVPWWPQLTRWTDTVEAQWTWWLGGAVALSLAIRLLRVWWLLRHTSTVHGSETWATKWQLWRAGCFNTEGFILARAYGRYIRSLFEQNVVLFAPPGEGKTSGPIAGGLVARTQSRSRTPSAVVMDLSGELIELTARYRSTLGPVYIWEPASLTSDLLNPYDLVDWGTANETEQVQRLTSHVVSSMGLRTSSGAAHYERVADDVLATLSQYVAYASTPHRCTFAQMLDVFSDVTKKPRVFLQSLAHHEHPSIRRGAGRLLQQSERKLSDDWSAATEWLTRWEDPKLARSTSRTTIPWRALQVGPDPMTLYIRVSSDDARGRLHRLIRMTYDLMVFQLAHTGVRSQRRELDWYFDDVGILGDFPPLDDIAVEHRKDRYRMIAAFQAPEQAWHESGRYAGLLNSCGCWVIYRQNSPDSAKFLEAKLGETTVMEPLQRVTTSIGRWGRSRSLQPYKRPMLTYGEIQSMRPGKVVVCLRDLKVQGDRISVYADRHFQPYLGGVQT